MFRWPIRGMVKKSSMTFHTLKDSTNVSPFLCNASAFLYHEKALGVMTSILAVLTEDPKYKHQNTDVM